MVTDQVIRMAFVRALLQLQLDVFVRPVAHSVQDPVAPRWTTPETEYDSSLALAPLSQSVS